MPEKMGSCIKTYFSFWFIWFYEEKFGNENDRRVNLKYVENIFVVLRAVNIEICRNDFIFNTVFISKMLYTYLVFIQPYLVG